MTDFCDYAVINLTHDKKSSGIKQYYHNEAALDKLLKTAVDARNNELGKLAAFEFEQVNNDITDYTSSVQRFFQRNSLVSSLKPMMLFVEIRLDDLLSVKGEKQSIAEAKVQQYLQILAAKCLKYKLDGILIQDSNDENQRKILSTLRKHDINR